MMRTNAIVVVCCIFMVQISGSYSIRNHNSVFNAIDAQPSPRNKRDGSKLALASFGMKFPKIPKFDIDSLKNGLRRRAVTLSPATVKATAALVTIMGLFSIVMNKVLWTPSRKYSQESNSVAQEYDAWEREGILEYYWGEHIHLGYYEDSVQRQRIPFLPPKKNFIQAKFDFIDEMLRFGQFPTDSLAVEAASMKVNSLEESTAESPAGSEIRKPSVLKILDVGCGIGGTSRYLAKRLGDGALVTGITLSPNQARRASELAATQGVTNTEFKVMDALKMDFPDNSFDFVWACESGEHMPDKKKYVEEMTRVLKPGGRIVIATWCQREEGSVPFTKKERRMLDFLYSEWTHPYFISIEEYKRLLEGTGLLQDVVTDNWSRQTIPSWLHSIWVGVFDPMPVLRQPKLWWKCFRDGLTLVRMHLSFRDGLMQYGMMTAQKTKPM